MDQLYREFGRMLRQRRKAAEFTQEELATRVGLKRTSITNIERGKQHVSLHLMYGIADAIGCKPADLLPDNNALMQKSSELEKELEKLSIPEEDKDWIRRLVSKTKT